MKTANAGNAAGISSVGSLYGEGRGVPKDYVAAAKWYEKAAAGDDSFGMLQLASLYVTGKGVRQDDAKARAWFAKAAAAGNKEAQAALERFDKDRSNPR